MTTNRSQVLNNLFEKQFDLLVIGGGATGAGIALDATLRGLKTALVDACDFSAGSSSKSTKLLHGGVRYLERAFFNFDLKQLSLIKESLRERSIIMGLAPHLTRKLPIILPVYNKYKKYYYWAGLKLYEWLAGRNSLGPCRSLKPCEVAQNLPHFKAQGLEGGILYYDGQFDDARLNLAVIQKAIQKGATALNYVTVERLIGENGKISGAFAADKLQVKKDRCEQKL